MYIITSATPSSDYSITGIGIRKEIYKFGRSHNAIVTDSTLEEGFAKLACT